MLNNYLVIDLETGTKEKYSRRANYRYNDIVAIGLAKNKRAISKYIPNFNIKRLVIDDNEEVLVGHNIKFDLLYLWDLESIQAFFKRGGKVWDTMLAEYILSGQQHKFPALRDIAVNKYGCKERTKQMEEYWNKGIDTINIPRHLVEEDVQNDVLDTEVIYLAQLEKAKNLNMINLIEEEMDSLLAFTEMEYNGMKGNKDILEANQQALESIRATEVDHLRILIAKYWKSSNEFNFESPTQLSILLFGGKIKDSFKETIGIIKTGPNKGKIKTRIKEVDLNIKGLGLKPIANWQTKRPGIYQSNEEVLSSIVKSINLGANDAHYPDYMIDAYNICKTMLIIRGLNKEITTYYNSSLECLDEEDSCIHANFIQVKTDTGRSSCNAPNLQNQPKAPSKVMQHFISRYKDGKIVTADYKQIELVVQAQLSGDVVYMNDVINGIDFHCKRLALKEDQTYDFVMNKVKTDDFWKFKRNQIKTFSFQRAYGAGVTKISDSTGIPKEEIQALIRKEEAEYSQLTKWQRSLSKDVEQNGYYIGLTGRQYKFRKYPAPEWKQKQGIYENYLSTEILNYMIQGTATADLVPIMVGKFWREKALHNRDKYLMVNSVHDSIILDCRVEYLNNAKEDLKILEKWKDVCKDKFNYDWTVPISIDIKEGNSWYECA